MNATTLTRT